MLGGERKDEVNEKDEIKIDKMAMATVLESVNKDVKAGRTIGLALVEIDKEGHCEWHLAGVGYKGFTAIGAASKMLHSMKT